MAPADKEARFDLDGALDLHVHAAPSHFPRWGDAWDLIDACGRAGMRGVLLKSHHGSTVETAALLSRRSGDVQVFGGIALNGFVGGLNPMAVESAVLLGARAVWLPTVHARHHEVRCGCLGGFGFQAAPTVRVPQPGYSLVNDGGALRPEVHDIVDLLHDTPVALATGHVSGPEIAELLRQIAERRRRVRVLLNHVEFRTPDLSAEELRPLVGDSTWFEVAYLSISPLARAATAEAVAARIEALPDARWIMVSDSGQRENPPSPDALRLFCAALREQGVSEQRLRRMLVDEPASLVD